MKSTTVCASRAVRMYVPMQAAPAAAWSGNRAVGTASQEGTASKDARTARRLTDAILRARASRKPTSQLQQQAQAGAPMRTPLPVSPLSNTTSSLAPRTTSRLVNTEEASEALQLALSYGKSALLTHLAHQQDDSATLRPYAYSEVDWACVMGEEAAAGATPASRAHKSAVRPSTADDGALALSWEMEQTWAALDGTARVRWITSTPQGRRALRHAMATPAPDSDAEEASSAMSMRAMLSKYADVLVRPRQPRAAALPPAPRRHVLHNIFAEETQDSKRESSAPPPTSSQLQVKDMLMHGAAPDNANRASLRLKADAARAVEREKVWLQSLAACLGGDNAVKFVNDVKGLQRPREDSGEYDTRSTASAGGDGAGGGASLTGPAAVSKKRTAAARESDSLYSTGLLDLCEELGIRSPRRAYVLSRVLWQVDSAATTAQPIALSQVRELTASYAAEYDKEVKRIAADALASSRVSPEKAVGDFEKYQLDLAVDSVNVRLQKFQSDLPLLRNCTSVFNK